MKPQHVIDEFEADAPQHALAKSALVGIDVDLEETVYDDKSQENEAEANQRLRTVEVETVEEVDASVERNIDVDWQEGLGRAGRLEPFALNRAVDDLLRQVERHEVGDHRQGDDHQDPYLLAPGVGPDVAREALFHERPRLVSRQA